MPRKMAESLASSLTPFHGSKNEDINFFLTQIDQLGNLEKWSMEKKLLVLKLNLRDKALKVVSENSKLAQCNKYDILANELKNKFEKKLNFDECQNEFNKLNQAINQSVKELADKVELATQNFVNPSKSTDPKIIELEEKLKLSKFLDALRPDLRVEVRKLGPKDFKEAINVAKNIENALNDETAQCNNVSQFDLSQILSQQLETNKKILELTDEVKNIKNTEAQINNITQGQSSNSQELNLVKCHICSKPHITTDCWFFPKNNMHQYRNQNYNVRRLNFRGRYNHFGGRNKRGRFNNFLHPYRSNRRGNIRNSELNRGGASNNNPLN